MCFPGNAPTRHDVFPMEGSPQAESCHHHQDQTRPKARAAHVGGKTILGDVSGSTAGEAGIADDSKYQMDK